MRIIIIAPHHDDEVIGCGGNICLHNQKGDEVIVVFVFAGWSAIPSIGNKSKATQKIQEEAMKVANVLKVDSVRELNLPDRSFSFGEYALHKLIKMLRDINGCDMLYIPHEKEGDHEHRIVNELIHEAIWLASSDYLPILGKKISSPDIILGYEVWTPLLQYQLAIDITPVISCKKKALEIYETQLKIKNWLKGCVGLNVYRGITTGKGEFVDYYC